MHKKTDALNVRWISTSVKALAFAALAVGCTPSLPANQDGGGAGRGATGGTLGMGGATATGGAGPGGTLGTGGTTATGGAGGASSATGGVTGTGGAGTGGATGAGGAVGTGGAGGKAGASGTGGVTSTGGATGTGGAAGATGTGGAAGATGTGGTTGTGGAGSGGVGGPGGASGNGGVAGTGGAVGAAGMNGTAGTGGTAGMAGATGTGGTAGAIANVTGFVALPSLGSVELSWTPPTDTTYVGVLLLRSTAPVSAVPVAGTAYSTGQSIGAATVVLAGDANSFLDQLLTNGTTYYYKVFSIAAGNGYATGVADSATPHQLVTTFTDVTLSLFPADVTGVQLRVDGAGGYHLLVRSGDSSTPDAITYAHCASGCTAASAWTSVSLGVPFQFVGVLAVDAQNTPRVALGGGSTFGVVYRACSAGCNVATNWSSVSVPGTATNETGPGGILVDGSGAVWIAAAGPSAAGGTSPTLSRCAAGCSSAANWTTIMLPITAGTTPVDFQVGPTGAMVMCLDTGYLASCGQDCMQAGSWSSVELYASRVPVAYRFLPDGVGARMLSNVTGAFYYSSCDDCAPSQPLQIYSGSPTLYAMEISDKGQPRMLGTTTTNGPGEIISCDYQCDLAVNWTTTDVTPAGGFWTFQLLPGDRPVVAYIGAGASNTSVVVRFPN